jgi:hypothetical protein
VLIPAWLYGVAFYGLLGCAGISVLYYAYRPKRTPDDTGLPKAQIVGSRWRGAVLRWLPRVGLLGVIGAWLLHVYTIEVVKVRDGDRGPTAKRYKYLGDPDYPYAPTESKPEGAIIGYDTWIYNASSQPVRLEVVEYGRSLTWGPSEPTVIPAGTAILTVGVDHVGPSDRPPSEIDVEGVEAKLGMSSRYWLTWDR